MKSKTPTEGKIHIGSRTTIFPEEVVYFKADVNYTNILLSNGKKILVAITLKKLQSRFENYPKLVRVSRSMVINIDCIFQHTDEAIILQNGETFVASRRRRKAFFNLFATNNN